MHRTDQIKQGRHLAAQLDRALARHHRDSAPPAWGLPPGCDTLGEARALVATYNDESDRAIRQLMTTPVGDTTATLVLTAGLLSGVIHRHRQRPHRIADVLTELSLHIAERKPMNGQRHAANILLDEANRRSRRTLERQDQFNSLVEPIEQAKGRPGSSSADSDAIVRLQIQRLRDQLSRDARSPDLDRVVRDGQRRGLDVKERQRLARMRRTLRPLVNREVIEVA